MNYKVKDLKLAEQGRKNIEWAESQMGALLEVRKRFEKEKPLKDVKIGAALHVTKETAVLMKTLRAGGASLALTAANPLSCQDDVAAALVKEGISVFAWRGETKKEYYKNLSAVVNFLKSNQNYHAIERDKMCSEIVLKNLLTIDDGCDLVFTIHKEHPNLIPHIIGGAEETTTGVIRLKAMEKEGALKYPMIAVNESQTKHLMDNYIGTGQSTIDGILRATNILLSGKNFVVCGFGECGKGVARHAKGMGANVIVCEVDPFRALQAVMEGYRVMPIAEALKIADILVTVTGNKKVVAVEDLLDAKNGLILANAGHFDVEIDKEGLEKITVKKERVRPFLDKYILKSKILNHKSVYLCAEGRIVNLVAAEGHPSTIMSMSFCNQALAAEYLVKNKGKLKPKVYTLPKEIDDSIASLQLKAMGIKIDHLTPEQKKYLESWKEGT
jgi:adenosylhomocysteinase